MRFNEAKATQAAAVLLRLSADSKMNYMKLIKLLYLADREALLKWGRPITTDRYVSMDHGPVVSRIFGLIKEEPEPGISFYWRDHINLCTPYQVQLCGDTPVDELSEAEEDLLRHIYSMHGGKSQWQLRDETHDLGEWVDPEGSWLPIEYRDILKAGNKTEAEIAEIESELQALALVEGMR